MEDLTGKYNPYDFSNPVSDSDLFVGRNDQLEQIAYYLDQAKTAPHATNLAILGDRGSGKTSLLNRAEALAKKKGLAAVRVNLDESDAQRQLTFFQKIFDAVFTCACDLGGFGGTTGATYRAYLQTVNTYRLPDNDITLPFMFPVQYAMAMSAQNADAVLSEALYRGDLERLRAGVSTPFAILFDEGNVLARSRGHLQKLRNLFMNMPGYMLLLTGTPDLFPIMDEVFSPIVRQFKKISVGPFGSIAETKACIRRPLEKIVSNPKELFFFDSEDDVKEIHDISGGRPHEIQLICHVMFRRVQTGRATRMNLNYQVLEEVRGELEISQDVSARPVLNRLTSLPTERLRSLPILCACNGRAGIDEIWPVFFATALKTTWTKEDLQVRLDEFVREGVLTVENGAISFVGDDFEKVYARYYCREAKVRVDFAERDLQSYAIFRLDRLLSVLEESTITYFTAPSRHERYKSFFAALQDPEKAADIAKEPGLTRALYLRLFESGDGARFKIIDLTISSGTMFVGASTLIPVLDGAELANAKAVFGAVVQRASEVSLLSELQEIDVPDVTLGSLVERLSISEAESLRSEVVMEHIRMAGSAHVDEGNTDSAIAWMRGADRLAPSFSTEVLNNLGYLLLVKGEKDEAITYLQRAANKDGPNSYPLALYHLAMIEATQGNMGQALILLDDSLKSIAAGNDALAICVLVPRSTTEGIVLQEKKGQFDFLTVVSDARRILGEQVQPSLDITG